MPAPRGSRSKRAGFTLIELMLVVALSSITATFIYYLFIQNSRFFTLQEEIAAMHTSLQFASTRMELDIQRAGYMTMLGPNDTRRCAIQNLNNANTATNGRFVAVDFFTSKDASSPTLDRCGTGDASCTPYQANGNYFASDVIELMGNYMTSAYINADIKGTTTLQLNENFAAMDTATFERIFYSPGQLYTLVGKSGQMQIIQINTGARSVADAKSDGRFTTVGPTQGLFMRISNACGTTTAGTNVKVAPLMRLRYRIRRNGTASDFDWDLIRESLYPTCDAAMRCTWTVHTDTSPHPPLVIARRIADLQFWFVTNNFGGIMGGLDPRLTGTSTNVTRAQLSNDALHNYPNSVRDVRGVYFRVSAFAETEDKTFNFAANSLARASLDEPILGIDLKPAVTGAARVRHLLTQVQLINFLSQ